MENKNSDKEHSLIRQMNEKPDDELHEILYNKQDHEGEEFDAALKVAKARNLVVDDSNQESQVMPEKEHSLAIF